MKTNGFTIVELMITVVVIAILTSITVIAYNNVQYRARTTVTQAELNNIRNKAMEYEIYRGTLPDFDGGADARREWAQILLDAGVNRDEQTYVVCQAHNMEYFAFVARRLATPSNDLVYYTDGRGGSGAVEQIQQGELNHQQTLCTSVMYEDYYRSDWNRNIMQYLD